MRFLLPRTEEDSNFVFQHAYSFLSKALPKLKYRDVKYLSLIVCGL